MGKFSVKMTPYMREKMERKGKWYRRDTFSTGGPGGANVNCNNNGVRLTDLVTGISAESREERDTPANQARAFRRLVERMAAHYRKEEIANFTKSEASKGSIRTYNVKRNEAKDHRTGASYPLDDILNGELDKMLEELLVMKAKLDAPNG